MNRYVQNRMSCVFVSVVWLSAKYRCQLYINIAHERWTCLIARRHLTSFCVLSFVGCMCVRQLVFCFIRIKPFQAIEFQCIERCRMFYFTASVDVFLSLSLSLTHTLSFRHEFILQEIGESNVKYAGKVWLSSVCVCLCVLGSQINCIISVAAAAATFSN